MNSNVEKIKYTIAFNPQLDDTEKEKKCLEYLQKKLNFNNPEVWHMNGGSLYYIINEKNILKAKEKYELNLKTHQIFEYRSLKELKWLFKSKETLYKLY